MRLVEELPEHLKNGSIKVEEEPIEINIGNGQTKKVRVQSTDAAAEVKAAVAEILLASKAELEKSQEISSKIQEVAKAELQKAYTRISDLEKLIIDSQDTKSLEEARKNLLNLEEQYRQLEKDSLLYQKAILNAISVLIENREFGPKYFSRMHWTNMTKADKALFYLLREAKQLGNMGTPKGFSKIEKEGKK